MENKETETQRFEVHMTNHNYTIPTLFNNIDSARYAAQATGFECGIFNYSKLVATWSPLKGFREVR